MNAALLIHRHREESRVLNIINKTDLTFWLLLTVVIDNFNFKMVLLTVHDSVIVYIRCLYKYESVSIFQTPKVAYTSV